jgi:DNA mismatch repair protein MutS2
MTVQKNKTGDPMQRHRAALELDKILQRLAEFAACSDAKKRIMKLEPETELFAAKVLIEQTADAHTLLARFGSPSFGGLINVENALSRAQAGGVLNMRELLDIASVLSSVRGLVQWRSSNKGVESILDIYFDALTPDKDLEEAILSAILSEEEMADNASPLLYDIRRKIRLQETRAREQLEKYARSSSYSRFLQDNIITMRNGRYVIPVKNEYRSEIPGLVHDTSSSGATVFIEPLPVVEANNEIKVLKSAELDEMERILAELSARTGDLAESIGYSYDCAVDLNVIFAKANYAYSIKATVPQLNDEGDIKLNGARHPLIDPKVAVPIDIALGKDFDTLVITGPNTGGKTVSIKTVGLLTLMAMCGLLIPAKDKSRLSVFKEVLADIGDEQSIEQSLSTFSGHITNIIDIIKRADDKSLVLIDELGAGTDPVEGAALAMAILESLHYKGAKIAATTHYAELKAYALQTPRVENASCEFDVATLRPTYRLLTGMPGRSNAFAISERLGMPKEVVDRAKELVSTENLRFEDVVDKLERSRLQAEKEHEYAQSLSAKAKAALEEANSSKDEIQLLRERELEKARAEAAKITEQARRTASALMAELDKLRKEKDSGKDTAELARRARAAVKKGMAEIDAASNPVTAKADFGDSPPLPRPLRVGDTVLIAEIGSTAEVLELPDNSGHVQVQIGTAKTRVKLESLRLIEEQKASPSRAGRRAGIDSKLGAAVDTRLDLRGMTVDECLIELDRFIDGSLRTGVHEFTVVHGKGTGALRRAVQQYLKDSPYVKKHRLGVYGEGEDGVTIVELK